MKYKIYLYLFARTTFDDFYNNYLMQVAPKDSDYYNWLEGASHIFKKYWDAIRENKITTWNEVTYHVNKRQFSMSSSTLQMSNLYDFVCLF